MTKEQIIEQIKKRYPPGTIYKDLNNEGEPKGNITKITANKYIIVDSNLMNGWFNSTPGFIYVSGKWAEIINNPDKIIEIW